MTVSDHQLQRLSDHFMSVSADALQRQYKEKYPEDSPYPYVVGALGAEYDLLLRLTNDLRDELLQQRRRNEALTIAAEAVLEDLYEGASDLLDSAADVIEQALADGMDSRQVWDRIKDQGIDDDEIAKGRFLD